MKKSIATSYNKIAQQYVAEHGYGEHLSLPSLKTFARLLPKDAEILDVGCGGGQDSKYLADNGLAVLGIDVSREMIRLARKHAPECNFRTKDVMKLPNLKKYDGIWCSRVFHHISIEKQDDFLAQLGKLLKPKGILYLTSVTSDKKKDYEFFDSGSDHLLKKRLTSTSFKKLLENNGFKILKFRYWKPKIGMEIFAEK